MAKASLGKASLILNATYGNMRSGLAGALSFAQGWANKVKASFAGGLVLGAAGGGVGGIAQKFGEIGGKIDAASKAAASFGIATDDFMGLQHAADLAGVSTEQLNTAMVKFAKGVEGPVDQALMNFADSTKDLEAGEKINAFTEAFGKSGAALVPMLKDGSAGLREMQQEAKDFGVAVSDEAGLKIEAANDALTRVKASVEGLTTKLLVAAAPAIERLANLFASVVRKAQPIVEIGAFALEKGWAVIATVAEDLVGLVTELVSQAFDFAGGAIEGLNAFDLVELVIRKVVKAIATVGIYGWQAVKSFAAIGATIVGVVLEGLDKVKKELAEIIRVGSKFGAGGILGLVYGEDIAKWTEKTDFDKIGKDMQAWAGKQWAGWDNIGDQLANVDQWLNRVLEKKDRFEKPLKPKAPDLPTTGGSNLSAALIRGSREEFSARVRFESGGLANIQKQHLDESKKQTEELAKANKSLGTVADVLGSVQAI